MLPVRCFTCGRQASIPVQQYRRQRDEGVAPKQAMRDLQLKMSCCRRFVLTCLETPWEVAEEPPGSYKPV